jgi:hypothetical protein
VAVAVAALLLSVPVLLATAATTDVAFTIRDPRVTESSGLVRDKRANVYWTVNDSSDEGTVYGVRKDGNVKGIIGFRAQPKDVEAVAMSGRRLYVADIGDNKAKRKFVTVYYLTNPRANNRTVPYRSYDFRYPDEAHDAETLLVNGDGRLFVVTKEAGGGIYRAPRNPSRSKLNKLTRVGDAPAFVTDGVFLPDGRIALRTYVSVEVLDPKTYRTVARAATPYEKQGESLSLSLKGSKLLIGSEGKNSPVLQIAVPASLGTAPSSASTPPPPTKATPSATSSAAGEQDDPAGDEDTGPPVSRVGTMLSLALAGFVALVSGVVVAARRS